jgi:uncharacterized membrane protein YciS (DUF1049 family)
VIELLVLTIVTVTGLLAVIFLLGFRLGGEHWQAELTKVRLEAAQAEKRLHDLTRQAFITMAEQVERRHRPTG